MPRLLPVVDRFVDDLRSLHRSEADDGRRWPAAEPLLRDLLRDEELAARAARWPVSHDRTNDRFTNLLFYEDQDFGFVLNGLVKDRTGSTAVHDHGHSWVLYGLLRGRERIVRYERGDDRSVEGRAVLERTGDTALAEGEVDVVPPWSIHAEQALTDRTVAFIVRSAKVGSFRHCRYDPERGTVVDHPGPVQVPYELT